MKIFLIALCVFIALVFVRGYTSSRGEKPNEDHP
jgi:hypothetical protein